MYLKKLEIQGFKSFADRLVLEFDSGITSVVGPNGSGKSNIADSIRWVLGEQSAKTLRGGKMEDVIFAGTEYRKSMGFAEVSITIENSENILPVEYSEVTVTRRVYRSGESEYFINKTSCRLKDIHELFLDTGIGKDGYSIIGQGRVDEILSNKSEDRRLIFEEASGIMKYKVRKIEAEKKLEGTENNLLRINDIILELEGQLEPLSLQADTAKKYFFLRDQLKELEVNVYIENIFKMKEKIKEYEGYYRSVKDIIDVNNTDLDKINELNEKLVSSLKEFELKLETTREEYHDINSNIERCLNFIKLNNEKLNNHTTNIANLDYEIVGIKNKLEMISVEELESSQKIEDIKTLKQENEEKLLILETQFNELIGTLNVSEGDIENLKSSIMDKLDIQLDKKTQLNNIKNFMDNLGKRQFSIDAEINELAMEIDKEKSRYNELSESINNLNTKINLNKDKLNILNKNKVELSAYLEHEKKSQNILRSELQLKTSRHKVLSDMEKNLEGYNRSVKQVLKACQDNEKFGQGIHGALAQLITVPKGYETAIELTLGGATQNIVTTNEQDAKRAIDYLKQNKLGRATFLPISSVKGRYLDEVICREIKECEGFLGVASDLITYNSEYKGIILSFLGRVVIVKNIDLGIKIAKKFSYSFRIVTLEGDIIATSGSMSGGSNENRDSGILTRNREITELEDVINNLKNKDEKLDNEINKAIFKISEINKDTIENEKELKYVEIIKARDESSITSAESNIKRIEAKNEMIVREKDGIINQKIEAENELAKFSDELSGVDQSIINIKKIISDNQEKYKEKQSVKDNLNKGITDKKIEINSLIDNLRNITERVKRFLLEKQELNTSNENKHKDRESRQKELEILLKCNSERSKEAAEFEEQKIIKNGEIENIINQRKKLEEESSDVVGKIKELNKNIMLQKEEFSKVEIRKAKTEAELELVQNRLWDEYELTYTNAVVYKKDIGSITSAVKCINEYKAELRNLGPVNVNAIEDYTKTKERHRFIDEQRNDMSLACEKLKKVIIEMTAIMKIQFIEQFKLINENFSIIFKELFEGGRAELVLVDTENVLESGIDIIVQPPGKRLQNMMLLSGGEKAFTAIALLFSILKLRPTPFCILDEIEAALDDANVYKFAEYLKKHVNLTQFILITHRKGTMEASDTLYGVTMQEHGISKIVSLRLEEQAT